MEKRTKSIIQKDMSECFICRIKYNIRTPKQDIHEVFHGSANRSKSIKWGLYVSLCRRHHNEIHKNGALDKELKEIGQRRFEEIYDNDKFVEIFKKNYI